MPEAHTIIAMIATVLLLWGASLIATGAITQLEYTLGEPVQTDGDR